MEIKVDKDGNIDFGSVTVPKSWNELTLKMYTDIERYYSDKENSFDTRDILNILCGLTRDDIDQLPIEFVERILGNLNWLFKTPDWGEPKNYTEINGEKYIVNIQDKLKVGEFVAVDTAMKADKHNYAAILAILCRKEGELYDAKFENEVLTNRIEMWENVPVTKVMPIISFFMQCFMILQMPSQLSLEVREAINHTRNNIETLHQDGDLTKRYMKSAMKKLKKLEKSISSI